MKRLGILGSTGSIGRSCLSVVGENRSRFQIVSMTAGENAELMARQVLEVQPAFVSMATEQVANDLRARLREAGAKSIPEISFGPEGMKKASTLPEVDLLLSSTVGVAGLPATYAALLAGKQVALANKEVLVAAGELVTAAARAKSIELLPVDSEHNAVHQCLRGGRREEASILVLTASGGPFLHTPAAEIETATVEQALRHPTWKMGSRITIDSATMMNKGFEVIEACRLFNLPPAKVSVLVHPQSTIHSLVEFSDGSILAQLSVTDMRLPILYALSCPERVPSELKFPLSELRRLDFQPPDPQKFPCLGLAYEAAEAGGAKTVALNAADEVAVAAFLEGSIRFNDIARIIKAVVGETPARRAESIKQVLTMDAEARRLAKEQVERSSQRSPMALGRR